MDVREWQTTVARKRREPVGEKSVVTPRGTLSFHRVTQLDPLQHQLYLAERHALDTGESETMATYDFAMQCWTQEALHHYLTQAGFGAVMYLRAYDSTAPIA